MNLPEIYDSSRITTSSLPKYEGFVGKYIKRPWNAIKSGVGKAGKWIANNKNTILATAGGATQAFGAITGNPVAYAAGAGLRGVADAIQGGEVKKALEKAIAERQPNSYGNVAYSDFPRIHYSRKPASYKISQPTLMNDDENEIRKPKNHKKKYNGKKKQNK